MPESLAVHSRRALAFHRYLVRLASAAVNPFLWVFIFLHFYVLSGPHGAPAQALMRTLFLYALSQVTVLLIQPAALRYIGGNMLRGVVFGTLALVAAFIYTGLFFQGVFPHGAIMIAALLGLYRALYRVPYALERDAWGAPPQALPELFLALGPVLGGLALGGGLSVAGLLFASAALCVLSLATVPLVPPVHERYSWSYRETFVQFSDERNRALVVGAALGGAKGAALFVLVPLGLFLLGAPTPAALGAVFSAILLVLYLFEKGRARAFVAEHADGGHYVDEYTGLKEMGLALGRLLTCLAAVAVVLVY